MLRERRSIFRWLAVLLWMVLIFVLSHQPGEVSGELSSGLLSRLLVWLSDVSETAEVYFDALHTLLRKSAHFIAYAVLGVLLQRATRAPWWKALLIGTAFAISDEWHQSFIPGRGPSVQDVLIDSAGTYLGVLMVIVVEKVRGEVYVRGKSKEGQSNSA
jgi:VanZ family protein